MKKALQGPAYLMPGAWFYPGLKFLLDILKGLRKQSMR